MPLDETTIKTRTGLILEGCVAGALRLTKYNQFDAAPKYDKNGRLIKPVAVAEPKF